MPRSAPVVTSWTGVVYRTTTYDVPLWVEANRRDGRWNIAGRGCTQYFCEDPEAPFAQALRHENLRTEEEAAMYRTSLWQARVDEAAVVDYSTFERADAAGFPPEALVEDDYERCQAEADWLVGHGVTALLSPSAALPGSVNVTVFGDRVEVSWSTERRLTSQMPVQRLSMGSPPPGLTARVRYFGESHEGLATYLAGRRGPGRPPA
jgi:RES domain-containing protein